MGTNKKYLVAVALLAVLAVVFGLAGTVIPVSESSSSSSSSDSVTHFVNPPTYDSNWTDIRNKTGQYFTLRHGLNTTEAVVDIRGKQSLDPDGGALEWGRTYGGTNADFSQSAVLTSDGGHALAGATSSFGAGGYDFYLVKTDSFGNMEWNKTYGGTDSEEAWSVVQTSDGGYALAGNTDSFDAFGWDFYLVKTDSFGNMEWNKTYGVSNRDFGHSVVQTSDGGYAIAGRTNSSSVVGYDFYLVKTDSFGNMEWNKTYGGANSDRGMSVVQTSDGGYAVAGYTRSYGIGTPTYDNLWLVKTDEDGEHLWNQTYGGTGQDGCSSVVQTGDGGYALAGSTNSSGAGDYDCWLVKTDSAGNAQWNQTYGATGTEVAYSMVQTSDGGYALAGHTSSFGAVNWDFWLVKTDSAGNAQWNQTYGATFTEEAYSVVQTNDGSYALAGYTFNGPIMDVFFVKVGGEMNLEHQRNIGGTVVVPGWSKAYGGTSNDYCGTGNSLVQTSDGGYAVAGYTNSFGAFGWDFYLVKTDSAGTLQWNKTYGGANSDRGMSVVQTSDGGYAVAGYTRSYGIGTPTYDNLWLVKTDSAGNAQWNTAYGGADYDYGYSVVQTSDGGYAVAGRTKSFGAGNYDCWLVKTDSAGTVQWNKTYGGSGVDEAFSVVQTSDGGYAVVGSTLSFGAGNRDLWLVKTDYAGNHLWNQTYGTANYDYGYSVVQTSDGGYAVAGNTYSYGIGTPTYSNSWLVKTDSAGNAQWNQTYGGAKHDYGYSVVQTSDGGYAVAGYTTSFGAVSFDLWLVKTDATGNTVWSRTYGTANYDLGYSVVQTSDGGYAVAGRTTSFGAGLSDLLLVKTDVENGLGWTSLTNYTITLYRGKTDSYWNYVRVRIWTIKEPTWMFGDINQDGIVDIHDVAIVAHYYGQTFSLLSLTGIIGVASVHQIKKRKQPK